MQHSIIPTPAAAGPTAKPLGSLVVTPPSAEAPVERRHFVFGLFDGPAKAEHALCELRAAHFEDNNVLLASGAAARFGGRVAMGDRLPAVCHPFGSLAGILGKPDQRASASQDGLAPRIAHQITSYLDRDGAVLIVAVQSAEQERVAARTLLTSKCDVLLTHEVAVRT